MVPSLAFLCLAASTVSYQADAIRVDRLVAELSSKSGIRLEVGPEVAAEPVTVLFHERDLEEVLQKLAHVVGAEWKEESGARRLVRPAALKAAQDAEDTRQLERLLKGFAEAGASTEREFDEAAAKRLIQRYIPEEFSGEQMHAEFLSLQASSPATRAACQVLLGMSPQDLSGMYVGKRVVFSDVRTAAQLPFPAKAKDAVATLKEAARLMERAKTGPRPSGRFVNYAGLPEVGPGSLEAGYGKTLLAIQRQGALSFNFKLLMVDQTGQAIVKASGSVPDRGAQLKAILPHKGKAIEISDQLRDFAFMRQNVGYAAAGAPVLTDEKGERLQISFAIGMAEAEGKAPDLGLGNLLQDPVARDPLGFTWGPLLRQLAEREGKPLIATVSDSAMSALMLTVSMGQMLTDEDIRAFLEQSHIDPTYRMPHGRFLEDKDWLLVEPSFPATSRAARFNRQALKELLASIRAKGVVEMADAARYVQRTPIMPKLGALDLMYITHADAGIDRKASEWMMSPALPFLVSLSPNQWQRLSAGAPYSSLSPMQQETLRRWVFDSFDFERSYLSRSLPIRSDQIPKPLFFEPTERFANGVPPDAAIQIDRKDILSVIAKAKSGYSFIFSMESLAYQEQQGTEGEFLGAKYKREFLSYRPAYEAQLRIRFTLSPEHVIEYATSEARPVPGAQAVSKDQLPAAYRERYEWAKRLLSRRPPQGL